MKTTIKSIVLSFLLFSSSLIFAEDLNPLDPGSDPGVSPINDYIVPMIVLGIVLSFIFLKKKKTA